MSQGNFSTVMDLLQLDYSAENKSRISHFLDLSDVWLNHFAPDDIISDISSETKSAACNYHSTYLYRLSSERFSGSDTGYATAWRDEGKDLLDREINSDSVTYVIYKVNK